jgi:hypothetical protein
MNLTKDTYEYILNFADDKEIINMLLVNKKFAGKLNDEGFFKQLVEKRYPLLVEFKNEHESWKHFYLRMIKYIYLLKEKYGIPYLRIEHYNPEQFYNKHDANAGILILYRAIKLILENGKHSDILEELLDRFIKEAGGEAGISVRLSLNDFFNNIEADDLRNVIILINKGADDFDTLLSTATFFGHFDIIRFVLENFRDKIADISITEAIETSNDEIIKEYIRTFL